MYERILVPIDEGSVSTDAIDEAIHLAGNVGTIHGLHAELAEVQERSDVDLAERPRFDELEKAAEEAGVSTVLETRTGAPAETICAYAEENDIDIIVMGTHAREGLQKLIIGSVTEDTIHDAPCPVLAVPHHIKEDD